MIEDVSSRGLALFGIAAIAAGLLGMAMHHNRAINAPGGMDAHVHVMAADAGEGAAARPTTVVKPLSCEKLPNVPGHSITTALVEFPPNAYTPRHRHPGSVTAFVIKGALRSQMEGGPAVAYTEGQTWFEAPGAIHAFAENASVTAPAELLAIFVAEDDCGPLTILLPD
ncbi:cupin domain-containing protein [Mesorhizobium hawassense]|uniref:Cupin domain-containing protein n=1 Tax=Mesorhizobium hawassense TaxID=1209954 RepID=A0A330HW91_9HYPH|nr:cupin domain-containing protein [Mesorhizobium hawassense]RAZ91922.1 cupin domain-containing protein [Mesorhizobium hawassense]